MARWNAWWWAPDEWRSDPDMDDQASLSELGGGGGGGGFAFKAADPSCEPKAMPWEVDEA